MTKIKTAVFPVAGLGTRFLPATKAMPKEMLPIVDKPLIQFVAEEARAAGAERLVFVTGRQKHAIENHFDHMVELEEILKAKGKEDALASIEEPIGQPGEVIFLRQQRPLGLGHAIWCARYLIGDDPFAVLLADDFILADRPTLADMANAYSGGAMVATMQVAPDAVSSYGIVEPGAEPGSVAGLIEKPTPDQAPSNTAVIGRYILPPEIISILDGQEPGAGGEVQLTDALQVLAKRGEVRQFDFAGTRFDCGSRRGYVRATVAAALARDDLKPDLTEFLSQALN